MRSLLPGRTMLPVVAEALQKVAWPPPVLVATVSKHLTESLLYLSVIGNSCLKSLDLYYVDHTQVIISSQTHLKYIFQPTNPVNTKLKVVLVLFLILENISSNNISSNIFSLLIPNIHFYS